MSRFKRHLSFLMLGRHNVRETTDASPTKLAASQSQVALPSETKPKAKSILKQTSTSHLSSKPASSGRLDSAPNDEHTNAQDEQPSTVQASSSSRRDTSRSWRRRLDPDVLAELRYACYALDALIQTGQPAAPAAINAAVEAASAPKTSQRRRTDPKSVSNNSIPVQQPPTTAAHRSRAVSNPPPLPKANELPPVPAANTMPTRPPLAPSGVRLLSSAFSQAEERRVSAGEDKPTAAPPAELAGHEVQVNPPSLHLGRQALRIVPSEGERLTHDASPASTHTMPNYPNGSRNQAQIRRIASSGVGVVNAPQPKRQIKSGRNDETGAHPHEFTDESYSTPRSISDRAASTARTSLPATPSGKSAVNIGASPKRPSQPSDGQTSLTNRTGASAATNRSSNRHSRRPSSKIIIPAPKQFNVQVTQPAESPRVQTAPIVAPASTPRTTLKSLSSQFFRLRSRKSQKNLDGTEATSSSNPPAGEAGQQTNPSWRNTISGIKSKASRLSLRDYHTDASNTSTHPRASGDDEMPPMPPLDKLAQYNKSSDSPAAENLSLQSSSHPNKVPSPRRPQTSYGQGGAVAAQPGSGEQSSSDFYPPPSSHQNQSSDKGFRPLSAIKSNVRKSRSSIFLRATNFASGAGASQNPNEGLTAHAEEDERQNPAPGFGNLASSNNGGKLRKMLSALQFPNANRGHRSSVLPHNENATGGAGKGDNVRPRDSVLLSAETQVARH